MTEHSIKQNTGPSQNLADHKFWRTCLYPAFKATTGSGEFAELPSKTTSLELPETSGHSKLLRIYLDSLDLVLGRHVLEDQSAVLASRALSSEVQKHKNTRTHKNTRIPDTRFKNRSPTEDLGFLFSGAVRRY
jgi:hypothetical protein